VTFKCPECGAKDFGTVTEQGYLIRFCGGCGYRFPHYRDHEHFRINGTEYLSYSEYRAAWLAT
jgi:hypothetical protein